MPRIIAHVDLDAFFASVEQLLHPELRGKAVVVGGSKPQRGVVAAASYEARAFGIHSAMPLREAYRLCPEACFVPGSYRTYAEYSERVFEILERFTPVIERASIDEGYLDLTGTERVNLRGIRPVGITRIYKDWPLLVAGRMREVLRSETGLPVTVGIAGNKLIAKIATSTAKPDGVRFVRPGEEAGFLAPMGISAIPGLGRKTAEVLHLAGLQTVGALARCDREWLANRVGSAAADSLLAKANGHGSDEVHSDWDRVGISRETTFERDTSDRDFLHAMLSYLAQRACLSLRAEGWLARTVGVKLRYRDFTTVTQAHTLEEPTDQDRTVARVAAGLLERAYRRPMATRLVGVRLTGLTEERRRQLHLWDEPRHQRDSRLDQVADRIRDRFGFGAVATGQAIELINRHPRDRKGLKLQTPSLSR